jgi:hypothetical protein
MAPTLDATLAGTSSNSYVDLTEATVIAANLPFGDEWAATPTEELETALIVATRWLETLNYTGDRCTSTQRLKWPRKGAECDGQVSVCTEIPYSIKEAEVILAWQYIQDPKSFPGFGGSAGDSAPAGTYIKRQKIDVLEIEYDQFNSNQYNDDCTDCSLPAILQEFPWLADLLGCWLGTNSTGGNRLIRLFRN